MPRKRSRLVACISEDLGGEASLSTVQKSLIEAYAAAVVVLEDLNTRILLGQQIDLADHAAAISSMIRVAARIGVHRVPRDVTPRLAEYLASTGAGE
jgi:hypothetical protein